MADLLCTIEGCTRKLRARGWCATHHQRWRMHGDPHYVTPRVRKVCSVESCDTVAWSRGLCSKHLGRMKAHGRTDDPRKPIAERFWAKVNVLGPVPDYAPHLGPCWLWTGSGATADLPYGHFRPKRSGPSLCAHRWSYQELIGPIPDGLFLDHLCRVPACVNPSHLEPVTNAENVRRGNEARKALA